METKLQDLTDKVYKEGVEKARKEAATITEKAKAEAQTIIDNAQKEAEKILADAKQKAEETTRNTEAEIKLASKQTIGSIKTAIETLICTKAATPAVKETFADKDYVAALIKQAVEGFAAKGETDLNVILPANDLAQLEARIQKSFAAEMAAGLTFQAGNVKSGFKIGPKDGSYFITFSEEDFANLFKTYLRTKTAEMLFGK